MAWCVTRVRKSYLSNWYWKVKQRRGAKKAIIALARKLLTIIFAILKDDDNPYKEDVYFEQQQRLLNRRQTALVKELQQYGFTVVPPTA